MPYENKRHEKFEAFVLWESPWAEGTSNAEPHILVSNAQKTAEFTAAGWQAVVEQLSGAQSKSRPTPPTNLYLCPERDVISQRGWLTAQLSTSIICCLPLSFCW